jgi:hypothetical protein
MSSGFVIGNARVALIVTPSFNLFYHRDLVGPATEKRAAARAYHPSFAPNGFRRRHTMKHNIPCRDHKGL